MVFDDDRGGFPHRRDLPWQGGSLSEGDWEPLDARRGYTGSFQALRNLERSRAGLDGGLLGVGLPSDEPSGVTGYSPAVQALLARCATDDCLAINYDPSEPGYAELYDEVVVPQWSVPFGKLLLSAFLTLPRAAGWQVLDMACGTGYPTLHLARYLGQDCDLAGLDSWAEAITIARQRATEQWLQHVTFLVGDISDSRLPEGALDTITCNLGLGSFRDDAATLGAMWRLLRTGGQLLLTLPLQAVMREFLDTYYLTLRDLKLDRPMELLVQHVSAGLTIQHATRLVERAGFEVRRAVTDQFVLHYPDARSFLTAPLIQLTHMPGWRGVISDAVIRKLVFNEVERRLQARTQAHGGDLAMTVPMLCLSCVRV